jgi:host factor-I protein
MADKFNLQDRFLNHLRTHKIDTKVYLINGFQTKGIIKSFDSFTVLLEDGKTQNLIYKHAISTITPDTYVRLMKPGDEDENNQN